MRNIDKLYRSTYTGEDVSSELTYKNYSWNVVTEFVPNVVSNHQVSNKAVVIGNGKSRESFDLNFLKHHKGGLLAAGAVQTYGCNALYRNYTPHFLIANGPDIVKEIADSGYCDRHIAYTSSGYLQDHAGKFYLIPQDPCWNAGAMALYMAAFDGHKSVYFIGFDGIDTLEASYNIYQGTHGYDNPSYGHSESFMSQAMMKVFQTYPDVDFVRVMPTDTFRMPEEWKYVANVRQITFHDMANEIDLG